MGHRMRLWIARDYGGESGIMGNWSEIMGESGIMRQWSEIIGRWSEIMGGKVG